MTRGHYNTKQKDTIIHVIKEIGGSFNIRDLYDKIKDSTSLTTIYRMIDLLEQEGNIQKNIGSDGNTYYQYLEKCDCNHFYLKCDICGNITHVECDFVSDLSNHIIHDHKFHPNKEHIIINGICNDCYRK